jgi:hypothetical protein
MNGLLLLLWIGLFGAWLYGFKTSKEKNDTIVSLIWIIISLIWIVNLTITIAKG